MGSKGELVRIRLVVGGGEGVGDGPVQFCGGEGNRQGVEFSSGVNHGRLVAGPHKWMKACAGRGN